MKRIMLRYKVKADRIVENESLIRAVFEQLAHKDPVGLRYAVFEVPDGQSFAHFVSIETVDGTNPLSQLIARRRVVCSRVSPGAGR